MRRAVAGCVLVLALTVTWSGAREATAVAAANGTRAIS
jgi:hypothetical protein